MDLGLNNKIALVTGGARGLGAAIATALANEGAIVIVTSRYQNALDKFREQSVPNKDCIGSILGLVEHLEYDLGPTLAWDNTVKLLEGRTPDIVVNNIGDAMGVINPHCTIEDYRRVMRVNFEVAVEMSELAIPAMRKKGWGRIVNISSNAALENSGPVPYCAAKAALTAYGRSMGRVLATEEAKTKANIVMSVVHPGVIWTKGGHWDAAPKRHLERYLKERCPLGRLGKAEELAPAVLLLCSEQATFMQGAVVPVDAGQARHYFEMA